MVPEVFNKLYLSYYIWYLLLVIRRSTQTTTMSWARAFTVCLP